MHTVSERYVIGGTVVNLQVGDASAHITAPSGHIEGARKIIDLVKSKLQSQDMGFHLREHEATAHFAFDDMRVGRVHGKHVPDGDTFRSILSQLTVDLPDAAALDNAHRAMVQSWVGRTAPSSSQHGRSA